MLLAGPFSLCCITVGRAEDQGMLCSAKQGLQLEQDHLLQTCVSQIPVQEVCSRCRMSAAGADQQERVTKPDGAFCPDNSC